MEKLVEYAPEFSFPVIFHFIPGFTQSMTIGAARDLHKELGKILKKFPQEDLETKNVGSQNKKVEQNKKAIIERRRRTIKCRCGFVADLCHFYLEEKTGELICPKCASK